MSRKILIVGASSPLARVVTEHLQAENTVVTAARKGCDVVIDVTKRVTIPADVGAVINFAAAFGDETNESTMVTLQTNVVGVLRLAMAARAAGVKHFIQISSMSAIHSKDSPYYSDYAMTKRQGDEVLQRYCNRCDLPLTILRPTQVYGDSLSFSKHQPFIYQLLDKAEKGEDISIYGSHDAMRNYLHADDFSEVITHVIANSIVGVYPCLYPQNVTYTQMAHVAQEVFGKGGSVNFLKDKADIPDNVFDIDESVYEGLGYRPKVTLSEGIQRIKAYRERIE